jgi:glycosyltransferase involved in cell wall biosynthesis
MRIAIGAVMKDEHPYILEWVAYHRSLGFELVIADNGGSDDTSRLLQALAQNGEITRIDLRNLQQVQLKAYRAIIRVAKKQGVHILGFMDVDEFFASQHPIPLPSKNNGVEHIARLFEVYSATQFSFHWRNFGGKSLIKDVSAPVLERFINHSGSDFFQNVNVKSFFTIASMTGPSSYLALGSYVISSHWQWPARKRWYQDGVKIDRYFPDPARTSYTNGFILHFPIKTLKEFEKRSRRGDVVFKTNKYTQSYYDSYNINTYETSISTELAIVLKASIERLRLLVDLPAPINPQTVRQRIYSNWISRGLSQVGGIQRQKMILKAWIWGGIKKIGL